MKIKVLSRDIQSLKEHMDGKRRIMTYGAGAWANDIKKMLESYGYQLDYAVVDSGYGDENAHMDKMGGGCSCCLDGRINAIVLLRAGCAYLGNWVA